jgi:hypothetical protein
MMPSPARAIIHLPRGDGDVVLAEGLGDAANAHPSGEQHAAVARGFEPVIRRVMGC